MTSMSRSKRLCAVFSSAVSVFAEMPWPTQVYRSAWVEYQTMVGEGPEMRQWERPPACFWPSHVLMPLGLEGELFVERGY